MSASARKADISEQRSIAARLSAGAMTMKEIENLRYGFDAIVRVVR